MRSPSLVVPEKYPSNARPWHRCTDIRGLLRDLGFIIPDADSGLPDALRPTLTEVCDEIRTLEELLCGLSLPCTHDQINITVENLQEREKLID